MRPSEPLTVERVTVATRADAMLLLASQCDEQDQTKEVFMRKVIVVEFLSLDGVMESPEEWAFSYSNDEMEEANASGMTASDAMLLGRVT